jgi:hypothetical protein
MSYFNILDELFFLHAILLTLSLPTSTFTPEEQTVYPVLTDPTLLIWTQQTPLPTPRYISLMPQMSVENQSCIVMLGSNFGQASIIKCSPSHLTDLKTLL